MGAVTVTTAGPGDELAVVPTLVMAFAGDPAGRWAFPGPQQFLAHFPRFVHAFAGRAFHSGTAYVAEGGVGVALWLKPGVLPEEDQLMTLLEETAGEEIRNDLFAVFEKMGTYHPDQPHWYLPLMGVDAPYQGRGYGSALLKHALAECDRDGTPAYLESSNPKNIPLYVRHGFEVLGTIQEGSSPPIFPMLRMAR